MIFNWFMIKGRICETMCFRNGSCQIVIGVVCWVKEGEPDALGSIGCRAKVKGAEWQAGAWRRSGFLRAVPVVTKGATEVVPAAAKATARDSDNSHWASMLANGPRTLAHWFPNYTCPEPVRVAQALTEDSAGGSAASQADVAAASATERERVRRLQVRERERESAELLGDYYSPLSSGRHSVASPVTW